MSQKALKKRELLNFSKAEKENQHQIYRKQPIVQKQPTKYLQKATVVSNTNHFLKESKHSDSSFAVNKHKFYSTPNLTSENQRISCANHLHNNQSSGSNTISRAHSESDLSTIPENRILVNAKSEFHLKSIASTQVARSPQHLIAGNKCELTKKSLPPQVRNKMHSKQTSTQSEISSRMTNSITSSASDSTQTQSPTAGFADIENIRVPIIGYEVMEERARFTVYKLRVENPFTNDCWLVLRRYTDFQRLNNKLKTTFPQLPPLQLPRKKLFGDNFSSIFLSNRVQGLQIFINAVMANELLRSSQIVRDFFCLDEPPAYSESMEECRAIFEAQEETISHLKMQLRSKDDIIVTLQQQLTNEIEKNRTLSAAISQTYDNCTDCSKFFDEFLKKSENATSK